MLILGIDTSSDILGLALMEDDKIKGEYNLSLKRQHSEKLLPLIEEIFELLEIEAKDLDAVAVSVGPGSFTGLRIAITTAKILGRIFSIPVKGISSLEVMAAAVEKEFILPMLDARRERIYYSFYKNESDKRFLKELIPAASIEISKLPEILNNYQDQNITILGEKTNAAAEALKKENFKIFKTKDENNSPRAAVLARLGRDYIQAGEKDDIYQLKPLYLKKPQAEINWQQKYGL